MNIPRLTPGTQYSYTIEATNCTTRYDQKMSGVFTTDACIPNLQLRPDTSSLESGLASFIATYSTGCALDPNTTISYQTFDHNGNPVQGSNTSVDSTIGWNSSHGASGGSISGSVFTWAPGWELPIVATTSPVTFHVTIGNTAQTLTVTARNK